jgi:hypothetical protein
MGCRPGRCSALLIVAAADALDDRALERWIRQARSYLAGLPPK